MLDESDSLQSFFLGVGGRVRIGLDEGNVVMEESGNAEGGGIETKNDEEDIGDSTEQEEVDSEEEIEDR